VKLAVRDPLLFDHSAGGRIAPNHGRSVLTVMIAALPPILKDSNPCPRVAENRYLVLFLNAIPKLLMTLPICVEAENTMSRTQLKEK